MLQEKETKSFTNGTTSAEGENGNNSNSNSLTETEDIPNTNFKLVRQEQNHFVSWGHYKITQTHATKKDALDELNNTWTVTENLIFAMMHANEEARKYNVTPKKTDR